MPENPIERYLTDMGEIWRSRANVAETSFYPALERLLTDIGKTLSPKVRCIINPANRGAGLPDGGLFSADQFRRKTGGENNNENPFLVQNPSRGVIEAKPPADDVRRVAGTEQVERYWKRYGMVLVTNFRAFALIGQGPSGKPCALESFSLVESESEFWRLTAHPRLAAAEHGERMLEYLKRVLLLNATLAAPQDVAGILASYAHEALLRIEKADLPALTGLRKALEDALGLRFEGDKGEHFFRSTLIQTLFYGIFSAWVLWARRSDAKPDKKSGFVDAIRASGTPYIVAGPFNWGAAHRLLRVPMLRGLFVEVSDPDRLGAVGLIEVLDWTAATLNRVNRAEFFKSFDEGHAIQYFYEPFLQAFDPELRKELGVWYTPEEIVRYQVERVDAVLRSELGLADGLADPRVVVLDPCCGTGTYLRAVLRRIAVTLHDKGGDALVAHDLKKAAMERVFGFEILPAPFVIAHLQLGLELETLGAPLRDSGEPPERAGVYLTNALTGWELLKEKQKDLVFPGFDDERDAADKVKQEKPILVIIGNPPYNAFAGVSPKEEEGLVEAYKGIYFVERLRKRRGKNQHLELPPERHYRLTDPVEKGGWGIKKFNLDDLYIRFFRLAEKRIAEHGGRGVVSFISNFSYLGDPSFVIARQCFLEEFDEIWLDCMNGDSRETGKLTPEGKPDPSVFSTEWNHEGIRVGTAIGLFVKRGRTRRGDAQVRFRQYWGTTKRADLLASLDTKDFDAQYESATPNKPNWHSFRPGKVSPEFAAWPNLDDLRGLPPSLGILDNRQEALICPDKERLLARVAKYFDSQTNWEELEKVIPELVRDYARFDARQARTKLLSTEPFRMENIRRVFMRPMDNRWCYYTAIRPIWTETRPTYVQQCWPGNTTLVSRRRGIADPEGPPFFFASILGMQHAMHTDAYYIPLRLASIGTDRRAGRGALGDHVLPGTEMESEKIVANLSPSARAYLASFGLSDPDTDQATAELIWYHALAIGYSPAYLAENADGIRQDWPRIPLPQAKDLLLASAALGRQVAALLDTEVPVAGVTAGEISEELKIVAVFQRVDGKSAKPEAGDLDLTAGWGHAGKGGVTMPGKGKLVRRDDGAYDIFLNAVSCWRNVPQTVWDYTIGGYQVIKKWLSYREKPLLGRGLTPDEVRYVMEIARRLAAIVALQASLDDNYRKVIKATHSWPKK